VDGYDRYWGRRWLRARSVRHHRTSRWHLWDIGTVYSSERNYPLDKPGAFPGSWTVIERGSYFVSVTMGAILGERLLFRRDRFELCQQSLQLLASLFV
jgi:hypothetical protein